MLCWSRNRSAIVNFHFSLLKSHSQGQIYIASTQDA